MKFEINLQNIIDFQLLMNYNNIRNLRIGDHNEIHSILHSSLARYKCEQRDNSILNTDIDAGDHQ